ncbi:putative voltage and ligand gated potassium channel, partial [Operophtera brumata]
RADSSLTDEADAICLRPTFPCILQPNSSLKLAWHAFIHPYYLVFKKTVPIEFRFFNYMVTAIYVLDLVVHLSTGDNTSSQQMKSPWFLVDVIATLPIFEFVFHVLKELEDICVYRSNLIRFLSFTLLLIIACYLIAALQQGEDYDSCIFLVKSFLVRNQAFAMTNKKSIIHDLPSHAYQDIVARQRTRLFYTSPNEILMNTGDISNEIYVIKQGICEVRTDDHPAVTHVQVISISRKHLLQALEIPHIKDCIEFTKQQPLPRKHEQDHAFLQPFHRLGFFSILRSVLSIARVLPAQSVHELRAACARAQHGAVSAAAQTRAGPRLPAALPPAGLLLYSAVSAIYRSCPTGAVRSRATCRPRPRPTRSGFSCRANTSRTTPSCSPSTGWASSLFCGQCYLSLVSYRRSPFTSYVPPAPAPNTERFQLPRKHEQDHAFLQPFHRLGFFSILRLVLSIARVLPTPCCAFIAAVVFPAYGYLVLQWPGLYYVALLLDLSAYFDIFQRMLVGYFNEQGILIYHPASTAAHYMKGAFITDLFGCVALESLETAQEESMNKYRLTHMKQFLMLNRLIQLYRLPGAMEILLVFIDRRDILIVLKAIPLFLVLVNVLTCFMVLHSVSIFYEMEGGWLIVPRSDAGGSWLELFANEFRFNLTESPWNLHLATYFWVVYEASTTGYNTFRPTNFDLMRVLLIGMLIGAMLITYFSVRIISIRANVNKALAEDVLAYYEYTWDNTGGVDYKQVFKLCDQITLRTDVILNIHGHTFAMCPILSQSDVSLLRTLGRASRSIYCLGDMNVIETSDVIENMYFVDFGRPTIRCPLAVVATSNVHLLMINSQAFHRIISDFPIVLQLMKKYQPAKNSHYIKGNISDTPTMEQNLSSSMIIHRRKDNLYYKDTFVQTYLIAISLLCMYADVYNAGFQDNRFGLIVTLYALDVGFYLKMILKSANVKNALINVRSRYFQGELRYDILSCLPLELMSFFSSQHRWMLFSWLRLNRMLRIITVYKCLKRRQERISTNLILSTVLSVFIWFTLFVHWSSCLWYFIGVMEDYAEPASSWIHKDNGDVWCENAYLCSLYFVLTTFTQNGVGDIMPKKHSEVLGVTQETVDVYLQEIVQEAVQLPAEGDGARRARAQADRIQLSLHENQSMRLGVPARDSPGGRAAARRGGRGAEGARAGGQDTALSPREPVHFLLPATQRSAARHRIAAAQHARQHDATSKIFNLLDEAEIKEPKDVPTPKTIDERYPPHHEMRCMLNILVDE